FVVRRLATLPTVAAVHARPSGRRRRGLPRRLAAAGSRAGRGPGGAVVGRGRRGLGRAALARAPDAPRSGRERLGRGRGHRAVAGQPVLLLERAQRRDGRVVPRPRDLDARAVRAKPFLDPGDGRRVGLLGRRLVRRLRRGGLRGRGGRRRRARRRAGSARRGRLGVRTGRRTRRGARRGGRALVVGRVVRALVGRRDARHLGAGLVGPRRDRGDAGLDDRATALDVGHDD